jgi:hypothetical protein
MTVIVAMVVRILVPVVVQVIVCVVVAMLVIVALEAVVVVSRVRVVMLDVVAGIDQSEILDVVVVRGVIARPRLQNPSAAELPDSLVEEDGPDNHDGAAGR